MQAWILVGILVGWAAVVCCRCGTHGNPWIHRVLGIIGGLIGAYLAGMLGGGDNWVAVAIWAWAAAVVLCDLYGLLTSGREG